MTVEHAIEVGGQTIRRGTPAYDTMAGRVMWFAEVRGEHVTFETLTGDRRFYRPKLESRIENRSIVVEAEPVDAPD